MYHGENLFLTEIFGYLASLGSYLHLHVSHCRIHLSFLPSILVFAAQFLQPRLFQYLIFVDLGVVTKVGTMVSFVGMFGVFGCSIVVDKLRLGSKLNLFMLDEILEKWTSIIGVFQV